MQRPKILFLTVHHGAAHQRVAEALAKALREVGPGTAVEVWNALDRCRRWFRLYYDSYEVPLRYWPRLWGWIEGYQHSHGATGPAWLFRLGAQPLFRDIRAFGPDILIATEVGVCELTAMFKRQSKAGFWLIGVTAGVDVDRAWAQPEVDLYPVFPGDVAAQLEAAGVPPAKILPCGLPIDPAFASLPERGSVRIRLGVDPNVPLVLVLFGGAGHGNPFRILAELGKLAESLQIVLITGRNRRLGNKLRRLALNLPHCRVLGWVENMSEWMAAADLLVTKPGGTTAVEAINSGLPILAFDPLPGAERRSCDLIEKWQVGYWVRRGEDLAPTIQRLLNNREELGSLRSQALKLARPRAAYEAATAILELWASRNLK